MKIKTTIMLLCFAAGLLLPALVQAAPDFPRKAINLIVPYAAGGSTDVLARALAKGSAKYFPVQVMVVNQAGGAGIPGRVSVVNAKPDGYTLLFGYGSGEDLVTPHTQKIPYDQFKDLVPVCQISIVSLILSVPTAHPAKTLKEFVEWSKKQNRAITGAVSTRGASVDITMQAIMRVAGVNCQTIPFRGGAEAVTAVLGNHTDFAGNTPSEVLPHVKAGRLRILGVCLRERDPIIPDVPTFMEQGYDVFTMGAIRGVGAPKGTPDAIVDYLEGNFKKVTEDPEFHATAKEIYHPVMFRERKAFLKNMTDGFDMYGKLIEKLDLKDAK
ncbi:MAG TPA: tripartite tricarboxylate transporter substrate binding protein [Thermodesulfobacteriota bacterium]|nr:tripartite tricarboxylate transporter substrate binding protein [Thermodesulfobacteriota bacterium]